MFWSVDALLSHCSAVLVVLRLRPRQWMPSSLPRRRRYCCSLSHRRTAVSPQWKAQSPSTVDGTWSTVYCRPRVSSVARVVLYKRDVVDECPISRHRYSLNALDGIADHRRALLSELHHSLELTQSPIPSHIQIAFSTSSLPRCFFYSSLQHYHH